MKIEEGKRLAMTALVVIVNSLLIALNNKLGLGLDAATITALAGSIGAVASVYIWGQTRTDQTEKKDE